MSGRERLALFLHDLGDDLHSIGGGGARMAEVETMSSMLIVQLVSARMSAWTMR